MLLHLVAVDERCRMEALPVEILTKIFSYLDLRDILTVSGVSKAFGSIVNVPVLIGKISANFTKAGNFEKSTRRYLSAKIQDASDSNLEKCIAVSKTNHTCVESVTSLKLDNIELQNTRLLQTVIESFPSLTELHIEGVYLQTQHETLFNSIHMPRLRTLSFLYSSNELLQLFKKVKDTLETLKICLVPHGNEEIKNGNFNLVKSILENNKSSLRKLNMYDANFDESFLDLISSIQFENFKNCSMSFNSYLPIVSGGFEKFIKANARTLEIFEIRTFDHINQHHLQILVENALNIKILSLVVCTNCDYEGFSDFKSLKCLEKLKILPTHTCEGGRSSFDTFVNNKVLWHKNDRLTCLELGTFTVTKEVAQKIVFSFPNLKSLRMTSTVSIDPELKQIFVQQLKQLKCLEFT